MLFWQPGHDNAIYMYVYDVILQIRQQFYTDKKYVLTYEQRSH